MSLHSNTSPVRHLLRLLVAGSALAVLAVAFLVFLKTEQESLFRGGRAGSVDSLRSGSDLSLDRADHPHQLLSEGVSESDRALAGKFSRDTLPRLLRSGLIRQLRYAESNGLLLVRGRAWRTGSAQVKAELLTELRAYNKVQGRPTPVQVRDETTTRLLAEITPDSLIRVYP